MLPIEWGEHVPSLVCRSADHWTAADRRAGVRAAPGDRDHHREERRRDVLDVVPTCEGGGPLYTVTTTVNRIFHITAFDDGRSHETFTDTGTFVAVPLENPSLPSYTGKLTVWGGFNANGKAVNGTFTFNIRGTGSDGSTFSNHVTDHFNATPNGTEFFFTHCHD